MKILRLLITLLLITGNRVLFAQSCTAGFTWSLVAPGTVNFSSTSTGTTAGTIYIWNFYGIAPTPSVSGLFLNQTAMTYSANTSAVVDLTILNPATSCSSAISQTVAVNNVSVTPTCNLHSNFSYTMGPNGQVNFGIAKTGYYSGFTCKFHDGAVSAGTTAFKSYTANGSYNVKLIAASTNSSCVDSIQRTINVTIYTCTTPVNYTPFSSSITCNGAASAFSVQNLCGAAASYTWSSGANTPSVGNLCPGNYTVLVSGGAGSGNCCNVVTGVFNISPCPPPPSPSFVQNANGVVLFSANTPTLTSCFWNFGDGSNGFGHNVTHTYSANGTYIATLTAVSNSWCATTVTMAVNVDSYCLLNAGFNVTQTPNLTTFSSTSTGTAPGTTYTWDLGDTTVIGPCNCPVVAHSYSANGNYSVNLIVANNFTTVNCFDNTLSVVTISNVCGMTAGFTHSVGSNWMVNFSGTYTGSPVPTNYTWNFGDGSTGSGINASHSYSANGTYFVQLLATAGAGSMCSDTSFKQVIVNSACSMGSSFSHTVNSSGWVNFSSVSNGTNSATIYKWYFGDGTTGNGSTVAHQYLNGGAHLVKLSIYDPFHASCADSLIQSVNITGVSCTANSNFTLVPTNVSQYWNAIPAYPWNVTAASWDWGDNSTGPQLYTSHQYSAAGTYSICLTVTVSCGSSSTTCSSYLVYRSSAPANIINVNVVQPGLVPVGITQEKSDLLSCAIFPNPANEFMTIIMFGVHAQEIEIDVYNVAGELLISETVAVSHHQLQKTLRVNGLQNGVYFLKAGSMCKKIIINR
jgi:PKD repeat protein